MTQIPPDDILENLDKLRIRVSEKLKTVLELYNMEIHQKKAGEVSSRIYEWKILRPETGIMKERHSQESGDKTAWTKKSGRLLAMESQLAEFERRQFQFPTRYE